MDSRRANAAVLQSRGLENTFDVKFELHARLYVLPERGCACSTRGRVQIQIAF